MKIRVVFDSNVWRGIASPDVFPNDPAISSLRHIRSAIGQKKVMGLLPETIFTLEAILKNDRKTFFTNWWTPVNNNRPAMNMYLTRHLQDAIQIGMKIISIPRIAGVNNPDLITDNFLKQNDGEVNERMDRLGAISRRMAAENCGMKAITETGKMHHDIWYEGLALAPDSMNRQIAKEIAEWADGDAVAGCYGYKADYFCTRDRGVGAGDSSVLAPKNRQWLESDFGLVILTPDELCQKLR